MKATLLSLLGLTLLIGASCSRTASVDSKPSKTVSPESAKKPTVVTAQKPVVEQAENTFSLSMPYENVALTQGEKKAFLIGINRGENFEEEVAVKVADLPPGVTLESNSAVIKHGSKEVTLTLNAAADAALGDFTAKVEGRTASSSADFSKKLKITIAQK